MSGDAINSLEAFPVTVDDYADREGYESKFLGTDPKFHVPMPALGDHENDAVEIEGASEDAPFELRYTRFSVVMSKSRKFCRVSAVNIDGSQPYFRIPRVRWRRDPRVGEYQEGDEVLYGPNTFSRGHMVRRKDPLWAPENTAVQANRDTFHLTNAVPQVQRFNDGLWGNLEDHILEQGQSRRGRISVFTGPIFTDDDPAYVQGKISVPLSFYKVVVTVTDESDALLAAAFVQSQEDVMPDPGSFAGFDPGVFTPYQVQIATLETPTGLDFGPLRDHDALAGQEDIPVFGMGLPGIELQRPEQIIFGAQRRD